MGLKLWPRVRGLLPWSVLPLPLGLALRCMDEEGREVGREAGREVEVVVVVQVVSVRFVDSARRREVERPLRKDCADWRDLASC